ncbi:MAG TPA: DinB family protein [Gemmataceae bacterium]|nr:DinB family protein [Gemmataceae bacterium]
MPIPSRPDATEYAPVHANYLALVTEDDVLAGLARQLEEVLSLLQGASEEVGNSRHPPYTWSVKQVIGHLTDAEREFGHRAYRFARKDPTPLPGFEENDYVRNAPFEDYRLRDLVAEFELLRRANLTMFEHLPADAWMRRGVANGNNLSVRAIAYMLLGHARHHLNILRKRLAAQ